MKLACSPVTIGRRLVAVVLLLTLVLAGCDLVGVGSYPTDLTYPLRSDPIVGQAKLPGEKLDYAYPPGQLDKAILKIPQLGGTLINPKEVVKGKLQRGLRDALDGSFGTPARPRVQLDPSLPNYRQVSLQLDKLKLDRKSLDEGSRLYRRNCMHCHGVPGDGRGPTGPWVSPHPRDYRLGKFKFTSTGKEARPSRADLFRTLYYGLDGSSMPSFSLLSERELENLVSYIIHLSIRGELEVFLVEQIANQEIQAEDDIPRQGVAKLVELIQKWTESNDAQLKPDEAGWLATAEDKAAWEKDVHEGFKLFFNRDLNCAGCHVDFGRAAKFQFDNWGTLVRPNNLTSGVYRGGRRPIDFYWRIRSGIVVMPGFSKEHVFKVEGIEKGKKVEKQDKLDDKKVGQLVSFIQALPYPHMLPTDLREQVYGIKHERKEKVAAAH